MALPLQFDTVTLTGRYVDLLGKPLAGKVLELTITPNALLIESADTIVTPEVKRITLDAQGSFTEQVPATNDPDVNPGGWTYHVRELFGKGRTYDILLPLPGPHDMSEVTPLEASPGEYVLVGPRGEGMPPGGDAGFLLAKASDVDFDYEWVTPTTGPKGDSAYQVAVNNGYPGTVEEWLKDLEGNSAYDVAVEHGFVGTEQDFLDSLEGPQGPAGSDGSDPTIAVGTVTTVPTETPASVTNVGTPVDAVFDFELPKGETGPEGPQGPEGPVGPEGPSAYEVAVAEGFTGTEDEWLASLVGPEGPQGPEGPEGDPGTTDWNGITNKPPIALVLHWNSSAGTYYPTEFRSDSRPKEFRGPTDPSTVTGVVLNSYDIWTE